MSKVSLNDEDAPALASSDVALYDTDGTVNESKHGNTSCSGRRPVIIAGVAVTILTLVGIVTFAASRKGDQPHHQPTAAVKGHKILLISDFHLDIFYNSSRGMTKVKNCSVPGLSPYGTIGCDSPLSLLHSMVDDAKKNYPDVHITIFTGDWLRHQMDKVTDAAEESVAKVAGLVGQLPGHVLASPKMVATLGNNDFVPDYYFNYTAPTTALMKQFAHSMAHNSLLWENETESFSQCGYYHRVVAPRVEVIVLNTVLWCTRLIPALAPPGSDPCGQFTFLETSLSDARKTGRKVYIASHIAGSVNFHVAWKQRSFTGNGHLWQTEFIQRYEAICSKYVDVIAAHFYGHTHKFTFLGDRHLGSPLLILGALSPVYGNDPSYLVAETDGTTAEIVQLEQRSVNMTTGAWSTGPSIMETLFSGHKSINVGALEEAAVKLGNNETYWNQFLQFYSGGRNLPQFGSTGCDASCRKLFSCSAMMADYHRVSNCTGGVF